MTSDQQFLMQFVHPLCKVWHAFFGVCRQSGTVPVSWASPPPACVSTCVQCILHTAVPHRSINGPLSGPTDVCLIRWRPDKVEGCSCSLPQEAGEGDACVQEIDEIKTSGFKIGHKSNSDMSCGNISFFGHRPPPPGTVPSTFLA